MEGARISNAGDEKAKGAVNQNATRKRLADISNLEQHPKPLNQETKRQNISTKEYIDKLQKENTALIKLLAERNKIVELSSIELQKMRVNLQKLQQQNAQLAQANSQMLAELNLGKDRLKELQHELGCKNGLLVAKNIELEKCKIPTACTRDVEVTTKDDGDAESSQVSKEDCKLHRTDRKQPSGSKCLGSSDKPNQAKVKHDKKRLARRQSARFKSEEVESFEDTYKINDVKFPMSPPCIDLVHDNGPKSSNAEKIEDGVKTNATISVTCEPRRSSVGRPLRHAAEKVQSYKEVSLKVKMRREV